MKLNKLMIAAVISTVIATGAAFAGEPAASNFKTDDGTTISFDGKDVYKVDRPKPAPSFTYKVKDEKLTPAGTSGLTCRTITAVGVSSKREFCHLWDGTTEGALATTSIK